MRIAPTRSRKAFCAFNYVLLAAVAFCCLAPMLHVLCCSISDPLSLTRNKSLHLIPLFPLTFSGYRSILQVENIFIGYRNTLFYVGMSVLINLALTVVAGYVLSRKRFMPRSVLMLFISFTMLFNGGLIPNYMLVMNLGLLDSMWSIVLTSAFSPFNLIIMRTSMMQIPAELEESAQLDGANDLRILLSIIIPVSKATIAVVALFVAVASWNSWFTASIFLMDRTKWPLQLFLREILVASNQRSIETGLNISVLAEQNLIKYCTIVVATLPILCVYPFVQRYFVKGVMIGSVKG
ncbi:MAG: carbohydrate ABC transporter permease [Christensenellaceae bacterium]|nr:carbohydrate ABC transporter permease [Christensenellaceae bacterium]